MRCVASPMEPVKTDMPCIPPLQPARRRRLLPSDKHAELRQQIETIAKMLSGLIKGLDQRSA